MKKHVKFYNDFINEDSKILESLSDENEIRKLFRKWLKTKTVEEEKLLNAAAQVIATYWKPKNESLMNESVSMLTKQEILNLDKGFKKTYGFTTARIGKSSTKGKLLSITHRGNMGNSIKASVDPNLIKMGFPSIASLKKMFPNSKEEGSPDYSYVIEIQIDDPK
jgi:hypothetical protein